MKKKSEAVAESVQGCHARNSKGSQPFEWTNNFYNIGTTSQLIAIPCLVIRDPKATTCLNSDASSNEKHGHLCHVVIHGMLLDLSGNLYFVQH